MKSINFKSDGFFFAALFIAWICIMYALYYNHPYFPQPLPSELESYKAAAAAATAQSNH
jgi:hypothetical protein